MGIGGVTFGGLASGLDTRALIDAILQAERRPIERLESRQSLLSAKKSALDEVRSKINGFINTMKDLRSLGTFSGRTATVSDETYFSVTANPGAELGIFDVEVLELAAASKVKSDGFASSSDGLVSDGTITLQAGSNDPIVIDVSGAAGNNSLQSVRDAINDADAGVQASTLFDGTDYRLIVRSVESGLDNALAITDDTNLDLDAGGNVVVDANDARIEVDGIEVTSASNKITGAIEGVTLDLLAVTASPVSFQVADDIDGAVEAVTRLTDSYNEVVQFFNAQLDPEVGGVLAGDSSARRMQATLQSLVTSGVEGIPLGELRSLGSIGVGFDGSSGELSVDTARLRDVLETQFDDVGRLFKAFGSTTDARIQYVGATSATRAGEYDVEIDQAAEQASAAAATAMDNRKLKKNETLTVTVGSESVDVFLAKDLKLDPIVDTLNAAFDSAGLGATASNDNGFLRITTDAYGSDASISVTSSLPDPGNGRQTGFDLTPTVGDGIDVAGSIGGVAAIGVGRLLTGAAGGPYEGLTVKVTASAANVIATGGDFGTVSYSPGLADKVIGELSEFTRIGDGQIETTQEVLDDQLRRISNDIDRLEERLVSREARLVQTFAAAEQAIALLQSQQNQLGSFFPA